MGRESIIREQAGNFVDCLAYTIREYAETMFQMYEMIICADSITDEVFEHNGFDISISYGFKQKLMEEGETLADVWYRAASTRIDEILREFYREKGVRVA